MATVGKLTERVTVQTDTEVSDGQGGVTLTPVTFAELWANVEPLSSNERMQAQAVGSHVSYRVVVQYRADITAAMRILWLPYRATVQKTLHIEGTQPLDGGRAFLLLECSEVV